MSHRLLWTVTRSEENSSAGPGITGRTRAVSSRMNRRDSTPTRTRLLSFGKNSGRKSSPRFRKPARVTLTISSKGVTYERRGKSLPPRKHLLDSLQLKRERISGVGKYHRREES